MGKEIGTIYNKQELRSMIEVYSQQDEKTKNESGLKSDDHTHFRCYFFQQQDRG